MSSGRTFLPLLETRFLRVAAACALAVVGVSFFETGWLPIAYRLGVFICLAPCLGSVLLTLIHRTTGGQWTDGIASFLRSGVRLLPWVWLLLLPVAIFPFSASQVAAAARGDWLAYDGRVAELVRFFGAFAVFLLLRHWLRDGVGRTSDPRQNVRPWVGPAGLIATFLTLTFVADDWLESLEPGWHSTAFPVVWMSSQVVSALALALLLGIACGSQPSRQGSAGRVLGIDWGNLLLATLMFWSYVAFCEFLIIWAGNLPEETSWYLRRIAGVWRWAICLVAVLGMVLPFFLLLSRSIKTGSRTLASAAGLVLAAQWLYLLWVIVPSSGIPGIGGAAEIIAVAGTVGSLFAAAYARLSMASEVAP